jgi:hypothetical protein
MIYHQKYGSEYAGQRTGSGNGGAISVAHITTITKKKQAENEEFQRFQTIFVGFFGV